MTFELNYLRYFHATVVQQSFTLAAKALRTQQPVVSRAIGLLESQLGVKLLERQRHQLRLTTMGEAVFEHCKTIFSQTEAIESLVRKQTQRWQGPFRIGAPSIIASALLPQLMQKVMEAFPDIYPIVQSGTATELFTLIHQGQLEGGLFLHIPEPPAGLKVLRLCSVQHECVILKKAAKSKATCSSFIGSREVDDTSTRRFPTLEKLKKIYPECTITYSTNSLEAHKTLVELGMGVAVLPAFMVKKELSSGLFKRLLPAGDLNFDLKLVLRKSSDLQPPMKMLMSIINPANL